MKTYVVDAFTCEGKGGNPAGVVLDARSLSEEQMQGIAAELGFSETAFILPEEPTKHRVRFFTPNKEVNLCGHATIASYFLMRHLGEIGEGEFRMGTLAGEQSVTVDQSGLVAMTQNLPTFGGTISGEEVAPALNLSPADFGDAQILPIQIASTGLNKIFVPVSSLQVLERIEPNLAEIDRISRKNDAIGMYCYSLETLHASTAHCRNFAPVVGISEDSATGTSAAALSCVLHRYGQLKSAESLNLVFEQGYSIDQPSELHVLLKVTSGAISQVKVAGRATLREVRELTYEEEQG